MVEVVVMIPIQVVVVDPMQELEEMQRQEDLLLKIKKRQKALEKYEKAKRKASLALEERNLEK